jgi:uncharacterized protein
MRRWSAAIAGSCLLLQLVAGGTSSMAEQPPVQGDRPTYVQEIEAWRFENEKRLASPTGWLALTAHVWLDRGEQSVGTSSDDAIRLPRDLGDKVRGVLEVDGERVQLRCTEDSGIRVNGTWKPSVDLQIDHSKLESDSPDKLTIGDRIVLQLVRRNGKLAMRVRDAQSEAIARFPGKKWFPIDPRFRIDAVFHAYPEPQSIRIVNIRGDETLAEIVGYAEFDWEGERIRLDAMLDSPTELFFVFKDPTSGKTTYGPGRFLNTEIPKDGESFALDFNKAYNPPCAVSPHTLCPLPPKQNHLPFEVAAGEKAPRNR